MKPHHALRHGIRRLRGLASNISSLELSAFAASSAFFLFLSLFPILLLVCALLPYTGLTQADLLQLLEQYTQGLAPEAIRLLARSAIDSIYAAQPLPWGLPALMTLWTAGKAVSALTRGMDVMHGVGRQRYLAVRLKGCGYTMLLIALLVSLLLLPAGGLPTVWLMLTAALTGLYTWVPKQQLQLRKQLPGALLAATGWVVFSALFSAYLAHSGSFGIYGNLATIIIALVWMYDCMYILLLGAYFNAKHKSERT